jgi:hypothetical protein
MRRFTIVQFQDAHEQIQILNKLTMALATALEGRLTPEEDDILGELFETQVDLQLVLDQIERQTRVPVSNAEAASTKNINGQSESFVGKLANWLGIKKIFGWIALSNICR